MVILEHRFSQYVRGIKLLKVLIREAEIKAKAGAEAAINKEGKKNSATERGTRTSQLIHQVEARDATRGDFTFRKDALMELHERHFLTCNNYSKHCWRTFDIHGIESFHTPIFHANFNQWQRDIDQNITTFEKLNKVLLNTLDHRSKHDQRRIKKETKTNTLLFEGCDFSK